ncbi:hypothetical protein IFR05_000470 [Cadophora sp. M221]|nr:hypothetical protein IFR05_000470 [Cadophora sp. M221]
MALARRDQQELTSNNAGYHNPSTSTISLSSQPQDQFPVPFNGKNHEVYLYLARECSGGWFPSFAHGQAAATSIVNCLLDVSDDRCAGLKAVSLPNAQSSDFLPHTVDLQRLGTLREEVEVCRTLLTQTLASLAADMDDIHGKSGMLCAESGPLVRALNHCHEARSYSTQTRHYLERTEEAHAEMLSVLDNIVHRWEKLYKKVTQLNWVLSKQLGPTQRIRRDIANSIAEKKATLMKISGNILTTATTFRETERQLQAMASKTEENDTWEAEALIKVLRKQLEEAEAATRRLDHELEFRPKQFAEAERRENERMEVPQPDGWGPWIWDAIWNPIGNYNELAQSAAWEAKVDEYRKWEEESSIKRFESREKVISLKNKIQNLQAQHAQELEQRSRDKLLAAQQSIAKENKLTSRLISQERALKVMTDEQKLLKISIATEKAIQTDMETFQEVVPNLCRNVKEAETNINHSFIAYKHINKKLQGCSTTIARVSQQMQNNRPSQEESKDLLEDINFLRLTFLVISDMAGRSSTVSRELYSQGLSIMAPLSIRPGTSQTGNSDASDQRKRTEALSKIGGQAAIQYDQAQTHRETFNRLCNRVENIVNSTGTTSQAPDNAMNQGTAGLLKTRETKSKSSTNWRRILGR